MPINPPKNRRFRWQAALATGVVASLALVGCAGGDAAETGGPIEHELKVSAVSPPNSLDPSQLVDGQQMFVWSALFDTLLKRDPMSGELQPNAAESWEYNEDGTQLTLKLRDDLTFSSGDPVTAEAVAATMLRSKETPGQVQPRFKLVTDVTAVDDTTVQVSFESFDPQFVENLAQGPGAIGDPATMDEERTATDPVGSGPFVLDTAQTVPGSSYVLTKRDDYWDADSIPYSSITVRVLQDPTAAFNALQSGEINATTVQSQLLGQLDASQYTTTTIDAVAVAYLNVLDRAGEQWPALGDPRVRQAISMAIDRQGVLDGIYQGTGRVTEQMFSPYSDVYDEGLDDTYAYDPEAGKKLVEEAGFAGEKFQIPSTFLTTSIEPVLSQAFTDIGLEIEWVTVPPQQAQSAVSSGQYGLSYQILGFSSVPSDAATNFSASGFGNPRGFTDPKIDELFAKINSTIDFKEAVPTYKELNAYTVEQAFQIPIVFTGSNWVTTDGIVFEAEANTLSTWRLFKIAE
ncbi:ABC transporter substrate-binding protein [Pseudoclavibacter sp. RFBJ3]|uniref:ABC transporter substrate-binding protein n=1 Tax=unclassified Pseudoclavibacter TaxID=2615177 RepID=UPI000CE74B17|nr:MULTISPECIES: ABC transporter substrate-binding protein [unclassified Pseudoclavibacter]PPF80594.1 ABC transporter substrate-binding protein [Pseudoclavibacter sp. RFBJ5]PPF90247.1 ABC transporter substrate-binding protein [Pseudoclavibacter sp. RFBJ3]PPF94926.1 ABC transporter substrate-binding protein [Pseudoclavibacter sp. RFBH5]PPG19053.1 ABC transporter substrate-binding protein [Pseudoclavibacter sp. RFBI4]